MLTPSISIGDGRATVNEHHSVSGADCFQQGGYALHQAGAQAGKSHGHAYACGMNALHGSAVHAIGNALQSRKPRCAGATNSGASNGRALVDNQPR